MARKKKKKEVKRTALTSEIKKARTVKIKSLPIKKVLILLGLFILLSFALYQACIRYGFVLDDKIVLTDNNYTKKGFSGIKELFTTDSFQGYFGEQKEILQGGRYRPLSLVSFAIEHQFFGLDPSVYHTNNILIYALAAFISFICLRRLFKEDDTNTGKLILSVSFLSSLLFLFHPIHTEAVANVKGRDEIMSFVFSMLSLFYATKYYDSDKLKLLGLAVLSYFLGLFSKENTITFLAIIPMALLLFRNYDTKRMLWIGSSFLMSSIVYLFIRVQALGYLFIDNPSTDIMNNPFIGLSITERFSTIMYTLLVYLKLIFVPIELTHDYYPYHIPIMDLSNWEVWVSIFMHLFLIFIALYFYRSKKKLSFAIGFYLIALSIVSNILINVGTFMNERFIFTASLGMCILIVFALRIALQKIRPGVNKYSLAGLILIILCLYGFKTIDRVPAWESELTLNEAAIKVSKNSARANSFVATAYFNKYKETVSAKEKQELLKLARPYAERSVEIYPSYYNANLMLSGIAAEEYKFDRDLQKLLDKFKEVAGSRPDVDFLTTYLKFLNERADNLSALRAFYVDLGKNILFEQQKKYNWAIHYLLLGNSIAPNDPEIRSTLVKAYTAIGRQDLANKYR